MTETLRKSKGKSKPIIINQDTRNKISAFKEYLKDIMLDPYTTKEEQSTLYYILYRMEAYEQNILLAYYEFGNDAAKMLGVSVPVIQSNVKKILEKIKSNKNKKKVLHEKQ